MNTYQLRVLDGTSKGFTVSVVADRCSTSGTDGTHRFFNNNGEIISIYPIRSTIIEKIETN
jgi:hypothetical protein